MKNQQAIRLGTPARNYETIVKQACNKVNGFSELCQEMERFINISGKSKSTFINYRRQLAHLALHYEGFPLDLDSEQVIDSWHSISSLL